MAEQRFYPAEIRY